MSPPKRTDSPAQVRSNAASMFERAGESTERGNTSAILSSENCAARSDRRPSRFAGCAVPFAVHSDSRAPP